MWSSVVGMMMPATGMMTMDRQALARALAKAQAYRQCGKQAECEQWAAELVRLLGCAGILRDYPMDEIPPERHGFRDRYAEHHHSD